MLYLNRTQIELSKDIWKHIFMSENYFKLNYFKKMVHLLHPLKYVS